VSPGPRAYSTINSGVNHTSKLLKKTHIPIALSMSKGALDRFRVNVHQEYASAYRFSRAFALRSF
jgi:hypothetical protein